MKPKHILKRLIPTQYIKGIMISEMNYTINELMRPAFYLYSTLIATLRSTVEFYLALLSQYQAKIIGNEH